MRRFCETEGYDVLATVEHSSAYMRVDDPMGLAAFVAYCSGKHRRIYLRGSRCNHPHSVPGLFRRDDGGQYGDAECEQRWNAYTELLKQLKIILKGRRWHRTGLGAVLQHYGFRTPWLDVVRNLHTAIWFATRDKALESEREPFGWISLYVNTPRRLKVVDLWGQHSSRHFRPHVQQGLSLAMQRDDAQSPCKQQDFNIQHCIARIRFRRSERWVLGGHMFSQQFLFPGQEDDSSLQQLSNSAVEKAVVRACEKYELDHLALGHVRGSDLSGDCRTS